MHTKLGDFFRERRLARGLRVGELARLVGYQNLGHGGQRIHELEKNGRVHQSLLYRLAEVLGIEEAMFLPLALEDRREALREWAAWANTPIKPYYVVRLMPGMYHQMSLPDEIVDQEDAEAFVAGRAKELRLRCCLVWSRRLSVYFDATGELEKASEAEPGEPNVPHGWLGL